MTQTTPGDLAGLDRKAAVEKLAGIMAEASAAAAKEASTLASEIARKAAWMKYLALATSCISGDGMPGESDRANCVGYLLDILEYLGSVNADAADKLEYLISKRQGGTVAAKAACSGNSEVVADAFAEPDSAEAHEHC